MDIDTRKPLEPWQAEDAARLKALFRERWKLSQQEFGLTFEIGSQGAVAQYLNGVRPLNLRVALRFARGLDVPVSAFSPTIAAEMAGTNAMDPVGEAVSALPENDRQMVLDFIAYRWERAEGLVASERATRYLSMIEHIKADMQKRRAADQSPPDLKE